MRAVLAALLCLLPLGCLRLTSTSSDAGASGTASASGEAAGDGGAAAAGIDCSEQSGGVVLCEAIGACPGVQVDPGALPGCGFRVDSSATIDLECECGGALCPIGVPQSCANAAELLLDQNSLQVCEQASEGLCLQSSSSFSDGGNPGAAPGCDTACESECVGSPGCIQLCGC